MTRPPKPRTTLIARIGIPPNMPLIKFLNDKGKAAPACLRAVNHQSRLFTPNHET